MLRTEFEFELPLGYVDSDGALHGDGVMRLATAADEILPLRDPRVRSNEAYLTVILLSRVITRLGSVERITPAVIEGLFAADLGFLQDLYNRINAPPGSVEAMEPATERATSGGRQAPEYATDSVGDSGSEPRPGAANESAGPEWRAGPLEPVALGGSPATP